MDFELNEEQRALVGLMKECCLREVDKKEMWRLADLPIPYNATKEDLMARMPWDLISKAHDVGLRQLAVPAEYGGGGYCRTGGWVTLTALAETAGYHNYVFARVLTLPWNHCVRLYDAPKNVQDIFFTNFMNNRRTSTADFPFRARSRVGHDDALPTMRAWERLLKSPGRGLPG